MLLIPTAMFDRVIFAGSVVPRRFAWSRRQRRRSQMHSPICATKLDDRIRCSVRWLAAVSASRKWGTAASVVLHLVGLFIGRTHGRPLRSLCERSGGGSHSQRLDAYRHKVTRSLALSTLQSYGYRTLGYTPQEVCDFFRLCQVMVPPGRGSQSGGLDVHTVQLLGLGRAGACRNWAPERTESLTLEQFLRTRLETIVRHAGLTAGPCDIRANECCRDPCCSSAVSLLAMR